MTEIFSLMIEVTVTRKHSSAPAGAGGGECRSTGYASAAAPLRRFTRGYSPAPRRGEDRRTLIPPRPGGARRM
jgi:hypothetical protein